LIIILFLDALSLAIKVHPKVKILSSFTHPQVVLNLYKVISSADFFFLYTKVNEAH